MLFQSSLGGCGDNPPFGFQARTLKVPTNIVPQSDCGHLSSNFDSSECSGRFVRLKGADYLGSSLADFAPVRHEVPNHYLGKDAEKSTF